MRHRREVGDEHLAVRSFAERDRKRAVRLGELLRSCDFTQLDDMRRRVRNLDADGPDSGNRREDAYARGRERESKIVVERFDLADLYAGCGFEVISGYHRAGVDLDNLRIDPEFGEPFFEQRCLQTKRFLLDQVIRIDDFRLVENVHRGKFECARIARPRRFGLAGFDSHRLRHFLPYEFGRGCILRDSQLFLAEGAIHFTTAGTGGPGFPDLPFRLCLGKFRRSESLAQFFQSSLKVRRLESYAGNLLDQPEEPESRNIEQFYPANLEQERKVDQHRSDHYYDGTSTSKKSQEQLGDATADNAGELPRFVQFRETADYAPGGRTKKPKADHQSAEAACEQHSSSEQQVNSHQAEKQRNDQRDVSTEGIVNDEIGDIGSTGAETVRYLRSAAIWRIIRVEREKCDHHQKGNGQKGDPRNVAPVHRRSAAASFYLCSLSHDLLSPKSL